MIIFFYSRRKFIFLLLKNLCKFNKTLDEQFYILLILKVKKYFYYKKNRKKITTCLIFLNKKINFIIAKITNRKASIRTI
jgi:hypothetical protein